ncbi:MAG: tRNA (adenosine(37)-N6)-threonylcarbamoyltransferase complex dimerization subunit type 1 TsaB [Ferruginibacter sp.]
MSLILNIDTSTETANVCIAEDGKLLASISNPHQKDHAAFLHNAINDIIQKSSLKLNSLSAIAVTNGPGSYTGLRVGMASAKGLCYALNKPLITVGSLEVMAKTVIAAAPQNEPALYCPLIDARRMEVYTALYNSQMKEVFTPKALILNESSFEEILNTQKIYFFGSGAAKFEPIITNKNAFFLSIEGSMFSMSYLSFERFFSGKYTDLVDSEPLYIKDFHLSPDFSNKK